MQVNAFCQSANCPCTPYRFSRIASQQQSAFIFLLLMILWCFIGGLAVTVDDYLLMVAEYPAPKAGGPSQTFVTYESLSLLQWYLKILQVPCVICGTLCNPLSKKALTHQLSHKVCRHFLMGQPLSNGVGLFLTSTVTISP